MTFEDFKKCFDDNFGEIDPQDWIGKCKAMGYKFRPIPNKKPLRSKKQEYAKVFSKLFGFQVFP